MKNAFCTIATASHIPKVLALHHSIQKFDANIWLHALITDVNEVPPVITANNLKFYFLEDIINDDLSRSIREKYKDLNDELRWSMKPVFIKFLLENKGYDALIFNDNDIYYFGDFHFLFDDLRTSNILLNPHWRIADPEVDKDWFETNFKDGLYNAGFVGVSKTAIEAMQWWAKCCLYACEKNPARGLWDDQRYLDMFPVLFEKVKILEHKGCDVAYWNRHDCVRTQVNSEVLINDKWPIIFIHVTELFVKTIEKDPLLIPYLDQYHEVLENFKRKIGQTI